MSDERKDAVVDAARAWVAEVSEYANLSTEALRLMVAVAALDETPEERVVRCARAWFADIPAYSSGAWCTRANMALVDAVRALPEEKP